MTVQVKIVVAQLAAATVVDDGEGVGDGELTTDGDGVGVDEAATEDELLYCDKSIDFAQF